MKKLLLFLLKLGVSLAILGYLVNDARQNEAFAPLVNQPKHWGFLGLAFLLIFLAVSITIVRWYWLVRALELKFSMQDAFRLGFLGYLLNFVSIGSVGGDLFKAVFIAREQKGNRAEAVASVVVDRIIGLFSVFLVASLSILCSGQLFSPFSEVRLISQATLACTAIGTVGIMVMLTPGFTRGAISEFLCGLKRTGPLFRKLFDAMRMYRQRIKIVVASLLASFVVHSLTTLGVYCIALGLPGNEPDLGSHFVIVPVGMVTGVLPLPLSGLGAFEYVMEFLYLHISEGLAVGKGNGLMVSLGYRLVTVAIALVGAIIYMTSNRDMKAALQDAEEEAVAEEV